MANRTLRNDKCTSDLMNLSIYLIGVVSRSRVYFTYTPVASVMVRGNRVVHEETHPNP